MTRRHWIYLVGGALALAGALLWAFRPQPVPVEAAEVRSGRFELAIEEDGKTRVRERYVVSAPLAGRLARIALKAGDEVKAGTPVAVLWPSAPAMIDARSFRELNERLGAADAGLQQARANVAREEASLDKAQTDLARQKKLQGEGFVSPSALDQAELTVRVQAKALEAARFARDGAAHDLAQARAALGCVEGKGGVEGG
jgi:HlyD family secretion protein